jgi:hypothetical protein
LPSGRSSEEKQQRIDWPYFGSGPPIIGVSGIGMISFVERTPAISFEWLSRGVLAKRGRKEGVSALDGGSSTGNFSEKLLLVMERSPQIEITEKSREPASSLGAP